MSNKLPSLSSLRAFQAVAETLSFTLAAERIYITQSAVSRQVKSLENYLGMSLLVRNQHMVRLTQEGELLAKNLASAFDDIYHAINVLKEPVLPDIAYIKAPTLFTNQILLPHLSLIQEELGCKSFRFISPTVDEQDNSSITPDCEIRWGDGVWPDFQGSILHQGNFIVVCHPALTKGLHPKEVFNNHPLIDVTTAKNSLKNYWLNWLELAMLKKEPVPTKSEWIYFDKPEVAFTACLHGCGIALIDEMLVIDELRTGRLVKLSPLFAKSHGAYWIHTKRNSFVNNKICNSIIDIVNRLAGS